MGAVIALFFFFLLVAMAWGAVEAFGSSIKNAFTGEGRRTTPGPVKSTTRLPEGRLHTLLKAFELEGYLGHTHMAKDDLIYVDNPILSGMLHTLSQEESLEWVLPEHGLRVKVVPSDAPEAFRQQFNRMVVTGTHAIGFSL